MSSTIVEQTRAIFEDIERLELAISKEMQETSLSHVGNVMQQHRINDRLKRVVELAETQSKLLKDEDGSRQQEISNMSSGNVFSQFYDSLRELRDYHKKHVVPVEGLKLDDNVDCLVNFHQPEFTGEESYGRYFDLHRIYHYWTNMKTTINMKKNQTDYLNFLKTFHLFHEISPQHKINSEYEEYLKSLLDYFVDFQKRAQPLLSNDLEVKLQKLEADFDERWKQGKISSWTSPNTQNDFPTSKEDLINLENILSIEELKEFGAEKLKDELQKRGLKCGGSLEERAIRLLSIKGLNYSDIPLNLKVGKSTKAKELTTQEIIENKRSKRLALLESKISLIIELLQEVLDATVNRVERNQSRTYEEIEAQHERESRLSDGEEGGDGVESEEEDDDRPKGNPKNVPPGYDGKPIPFWLFKLHGLGIEYKCQICGDQSFWGRRAFERHFQEPHHAFRMRMIGIPNTKHFHEITRIEDAKILYEKVKAEQMSKVWKPDVEEEFEDSDGNVLNRKTFEDLQRQGLL
eukprot:c12473_g1_i1.p1 GENE.c12473_g1_i1~~c12473_g1_i1.p1  ORF type:complete len:520 (-),score=199.78 c12473_g1_i1:41-1600(-)